MQNRPCAEDAFGAFLKISFVWASAHFPSVVRERRAVASTHARASASVLKYSLSSKTLLTVAHQLSLSCLLFATAPRLMLRNASEPFAFHCHSAFAHSSIVEERMRFTSSRRKRIDSGAWAMKAAFACAELSPSVPSPSQPRVVC